jgi:ABC-2 type transport system ATP-binding protein
VSSAAPGSALVVARNVMKSFRLAGEEKDLVRALVGVSVEIHAGELTALVGPDGAGKTTLIRLFAGLLTLDFGMLRVLGVDPAADPQQVQDRIGYMPQKFGLYEDLTVQENLDLYADLHGVPAAERSRRYPQLMQMTDLGAFTRRLAGRLSGGMKQKLGLACTLVRSPELLLLDEPTVGVDPLSRRELWEIVHHLVRDQGLTVLISTSYLDEAERGHRAVVLHRGKVLAQGPPGEITALARNRTFIGEPRGESARSLQARLLDEASVIDAVPDGGRVRWVLDEQAAPAAAAKPPQADTGDPSQPVAGGADSHCGVQGLAVKPRFEDGFMVLLRQGATREVIRVIELARPPSGQQGEVVVEVHDLVRRFGAFTAVDHVDFQVRRGEIFGLLGPNGAGKTTTFRMLCGLLIPTSGVLRIAGMDVTRGGAAARQRIGYVAQKFSLYGTLTVAENLEFFASAYGLRGRRRRERIDWAMEQFELTGRAGLASNELPGGYRQRLAMGAALLHEPEILFLDEPTSGADPLARRVFWRRITALVEQGVTVIVTTHFMQEAEYCDHIAIMDAGRVLAQGEPADIRRLARAAPGREATIEDAFVTVVEQARARDAKREDAA